VDRGDLSGDWNYTLLPRDTPWRLELHPAAPRHALATGTTPCCPATRPGDWTLFLREP